MSEEQKEIEDVNSPEESAGEAPAPRRRFLTWRKLFAALLVGVAACSFLFILGAIAYRFGVLDSYIKGQFTSKLSDIGVDFSSDSLALSLSPLALEVNNAVFTDKATGEKLIFIKRGRLGLTVTDLLAWQLSREISIDTTEIEGAEVWVKFDEEGRSNFSNLTFVEDEEASGINFRYTSMKFSLRDSVVHVGDLSRKISGDANNIQMSFEPEDTSVPMSKRTTGLT